MKKILILILLVTAVVGGYYIWQNEAREPQVEPVDVLTRAEVLSAVSNYVESHISELSPEKEVLGGTFYVVSIDYLENKGIVNYEDGHIALSSTFNFEVDGEKNVTITDFRILSDSADYGFEKAGNIVSGEDGKWSLVYEEPGKPALKKELVFEKESLCTSGQETVFCTSYVMNQGDRVEVKGEESGEDAISVGRMQAI
jgi:hypothetical protein